MYQWILSLGVEYGYAAKGDLQAAGADYVVTDLKALDQFFKEQV